jgi:hypothetical protein
MGRPCTALNTRGEPCRSTSVDESGLCAFHGRRSPFGTVEVAREAGRVSVKRRRDRAAARRLSALDWAAKIVEERGQELAESFLRAARNGDWRAADALMNRIYGKPEAALVAHVPQNPMADVIRSMSLDEKLELLHSLKRGEALDLPVVEARSLDHSSSKPDNAQEA